MRTALLLALALSACAPTDTDPEPPDTAGTYEECMRPCLARGELSQACNCKCDPTCTRTATVKEDA